MKAQNYTIHSGKKLQIIILKGTYKSSLLILDIQNRAIKEDNTIQLIKSPESRI